MFLWHSPWGCPRWMLSSIPLYGVRTFLRWLSGHPRLPRLLKPIGKCIILYSPSSSSAHFMGALLPTHLQPCTERSNMGYSIVPKSSYVTDSQFWGTLDSLSEQGISELAALLARRKQFAMSGNKPARFFSSARLVLGCQFSINDQPQQILFDRLQPGARTTPKEFHQFVSIQWAFQGHPFGFFFQQSGAFAQLLHTRNSAADFFGAITGNISLREIEQLRKILIGLQHQTPHGSIRPITRIGIGTHMQMHQKADGINLLSGTFEPSQNIAGHCRAHIFMPKEMHLAILDRARARLTNIMQQRRPASDEMWWRILHDLQRMGIDILRMHWSLAHPTQLQYFWDHPLHQAKVNHQAQPQHWHGRQQNFIHLVADALSADLFQCLCPPGNCLGGLLFNGEIQLRRKTYHAQQAQRVFVKALLRIIAHRAQQPRLQISPPTIGVDDGASQRVARHRINRQITPQQIFFQDCPKRHLWPARIGIIALRAKRGNLDNILLCRPRSLARCFTNGTLTRLFLSTFLPPEIEAHRAETLAHQHNSAWMRWGDQLLNLLRSRVSGEISIRAGATL